MTIQGYLSKMGKIQTSILAYIDDSDNSAKRFLQLIQIFNDLKIRSNQHELKSLLHILQNIADNHHRGPYFFDKIQKIINNFKIDIKKYFSNLSIFNIFKSNKRILLFLLNEKILTMDKIIASIITKESEYKDANYEKYLFNSIKPFLDDKSVHWIAEELPDNFEEKILIGENDNCLCELIRNDMIKDFTDLVTKEKIVLTGQIRESIFETNSFLIKKRITFIEYAAFFGSIQIIKYLEANGIKLEPSLWIYAIHGRNKDLFRLLEKSHITPVDKTECLYEVIKCHHNEIMSYITNRYFTNKDDDRSINSLIQCLEYYNISLIEQKSVDLSSFFYLCQYDYFQIVSIFSKDKNLDINKTSIDF